MKIGLTEARIQVSARTPTENFFWAARFLLTRVPLSHSPRVIRLIAF